MELTASSENWSLVNVPLAHVSPDTAAALVPVTWSPEMARPPSETSVQSAPRAPSARSKSSLPGLAVSVQVTATSVISDELTVPDPLETEQDWPDGLELTVTS